MATQTQPTSAMFRALRSVNVEPELAQQAIEENRNEAGQNVIAAIGAQLAELRSDLRTEMQAGFARVDQRFEEVNTRFAEVNGRIDTMSEQLGGRIDSLSGQVNGRIDTMSEQLGGRIDTMSEQLGGRIDTLEGKVQTVIRIVWPLVIGLLIAVTGTTSAFLYKAFWQ